MTTIHLKTVRPSPETLCISNIYYTKPVIKPTENL